MAGLVLNIIVGLVLIVTGNMILNESATTTPLMKKIQELTNSIIGADYHIPFYVAGGFFVLLGLLALLVAFMIFAQQHGFWIV